MKKTENLRDSSKLDPVIFSVLFSLLKQTRTAQPSGLPLWCGMRLAGAVFAAAKTSGFRAAAQEEETRSAERVPPTRSFRLSVTAIPRGQ